jgi:hypothetical protein
MKAPLLPSAGAESMVPPEHWIALLHDEVIEITVVGGRQEFPHFNPPEALRAVVEFVF